MKEVFIEEDGVRWMRRAIDLARRGRFTSPNPRVGAVIVRDGEVLGEGFHARAGEGHAEVEAVRDAKVRGNGDGIREATLYVTLEPCSTRGKTGACTDLIIGEGVRRVVVGACDPNPAHAGRGFQILRDAGVEVVSGVLGEEAEALNPEFNRWVVKGMPWVVVKVAMSLEGNVSRPVGESSWLTGEEARREVHEERARCDAILVGAETVRVDDPALTVRGVRKRDEEWQPWRVVVTRSGNLPAGCQVFRDEWCERTLVYEGREWEDVFRDLGKRGVTRVMVEGGGEVISDLVRGEWVDEVWAYFAPVSDSVEVSGLLRGAQCLRDLRLGDVDVKVLGEDLRVSGVVER